MDLRIPSPAFETIDLPGNDYAFFTDAFERLSGIRLNLYKEKQMKRRINTLILRKKLRTYRDFISLLEKDPAELDAFIDYITINVTEFFRTPDQWKDFETEALTELVHSAQEPLKIWSCACATGEEPCSLAMTLRDYIPADAFHILATDLDEKALARAQSGVYDTQAAAALPERMRDRYTERNGAQWKISPEIRNSIEFRRLDLLRDEYPSGCDLIVCRNVLIYFTEDAKQMIYEKIRQSLKPGGYLFTGNTEQIIYYKALGFTKVRNYLYRKL